MKTPIIFAITSLFAANCAYAVSFNEDVRPILADRCFACHGPDSASRKADLRLDREEFAKAQPGDSDVIPIVPGKPESSAIIQRLKSHDPDEVMPPPESKLKVSAKEIALIEQWIVDGAEWQRHWAFIPPQKTTPPVVNDRTWSRNEIDRFVLATLEAGNLEPSAPAGKPHLLRRLGFDLTGLPPSLAELDAFIADTSEEAVERVVDRLLASPAFGERLALEWLDVARYGDTDGLFEDHPRSIYPWRDWVVSAFNQNLPYSDFISWQLAGDLLPEASREQKIATGFLRNNPTSNEGGIIDEDYRIKYLIDRTNTTSTAFLGLTMECSQCHDHKFDPMTQREYYQMSGFFNSLVGNGNTKGSTDPVLKMLQPEQEKRLAQIDPQIEAVQQALGESPPELHKDFENWLAELGKPIAWKSPPVVSHSGRAEKDAEPDQPVKTSKVSGRFVRIESAKGHSGFITISEVEIFSGGSNIARAGTAKQSSDYGGGSVAGKAIDGKKDGSFASCACTLDQENPWWEIDLGTMKPIDHILVYNRNDCCPERLDNVTVGILDQDRKITTARKIGDAPFLTGFAFNPDAPKPESGPKSYEIVVAPDAGKLASLQLTSEEPAFIESLHLETIGSDGKARPLKLKGAAKLKIEKDAKIVALEETVELAAGETLKIAATGDLIEVKLTGDETAATRTAIPKDREKRLAHFRGIWAGFEVERKQLETLTKEKAEIEKTAVITMVAADESKMRSNHILMRGEYDKPGEQVETSAPASIMEFSADLPKNRLGLARWMVDPNNPLTARVAVNRYWQMIFATGIVPTSEDFGTQGARPSHQALLDYLAVDFVESGWDVKRLIRKMVTSATYQQESRRSEAIAERDPGNRLLSRAPRRRLAAEFVRDHALAVSGLLVDKRGGVGVQPYQPAALFGRNAIGSSNASFNQGTGDDLYRRSLYTYWKRQIPAANMRILGADGRNSCRTRRELTNTPLQALVLLNDPQFIEAARALGARAMNEGGQSVEERLSYAFRLSTSRAVTGSELVILVAEFNDRLREFQADAATAKAFLAGGGALKPDPNLDAVELAAYAAVASLILNLDESISKS
jgi:hypothetical protein